MKKIIEKLDVYLNNIKIKKKKLRKRWIMPRRAMIVLGKALKP